MRDKHRQRLDGTDANGYNYSYGFIDETMFAPNRDTDTQFPDEMTQMHDLTQNEDEDRKTNIIEYAVAEYCEPANAGHESITSQPDTVNQPLYGNDMQPPAASVSTFQRILAATSTSSANSRCNATEQSSFSASVSTCNGSTRRHSNNRSAHNQSAEEWENRATPTSNTPNRQHKDTSNSPRSSRLNIQSNYNLGRVSVNLTKLDIPSSTPSTPVALRNRSSRLSREKRSATNRNSDAIPAGSSASNAMSTPMNSLTNGHGGAATSRKRKRTNKNRVEEDEATEATNCSDVISLADTEITKITGNETSLAGGPAIPVTDSDHNFLLSLYPYLCDLKGAQKLKVRMKIEKMLYEELYGNDDLSEN